MGVIQKFSLRLTTLPKRTKAEKPSITNAQANPGIGAAPQSLFFRILPAEFSSTIHSEFPSKVFPLIVFKKELCMSIPMEFI
jgi:hypothetical protein